MSEIYAPYIAALQTITSLGPITIRRLIDRLGNAKNVWEASDIELRSTGMMKANMVEDIKEARRNFSFDTFENKLAKNDIQYITYKEEGFPQQLNTIYSPPTILFYSGALNFPNQAVAIVGARKSSNYGRSNAHYFAKYLSENGVSIISGGARGIDTAAHKGALEGISSTIAVMGCGLDIIYPRENEKLFDQIIEQGMVISEFPPGTPPIGYNFPRRNQIISGLSRGIIVVKARSSSGSLITADMANNDGRDVFAIPGNILQETSEGTNWLIKQGAIPAISPEDILMEYRWDLASKKTETKKENISSQADNSMLSLTTEEKNILEHLSYDIIKDIDTLVVETKLSLTDLGLLLFQLECNEFIKQESNGGYILIPRR